MSTWKLDVEQHDGDEKAICVGQWCCGCAEHPIGKPWGWNYLAWEAHNAEHHVQFGTPLRGRA